MRKNKFFTFVFSLIPGVGHLYLGLFNQGVELMLLFASAIAIETMLQIEVIIFVIPIIWFYAMFDALNKCSKDYVQDTHLEILNFIDVKNPFSKSGTRYIGISLIVLGILCIINTILPSILQRLFRNLDVYFIMRNFRTALLAIFLILAGVKILKGSKFHKKEDEFYE